MKRIKATAIFARKFRDVLLHPIEQGETVEIWRDEDFPGVLYFIRMENGKKFEMEPAEVAEVFGEDVLAQLTEVNMTQTAFYRCPQGHTESMNRDTPFIYLAEDLWLILRLCQSDELGVLAYDTLKPSNRWEDGTAGVPQALWDYLNDGDIKPVCIICGEEPEAVVPAYTVFDVLHLADDQWGSETMKSEAEAYFAAHPKVNFVLVHEHGGWYLGFRRNGTIWATANDRAILSDPQPRPTQFSGVSVHLPPGGSKAIA